MAGEDKRIDQLPPRTPVSTDLLLLEDVTTQTYAKTTVSAISTAAAASSPVQSVAGKTGIVTLVKSDVGLSLVDNTADVSKPVSSVQAAAIATKQATLVSGTNIKTVNGTTLLGEGNIVIAGADGADKNYLQAFLTATTVAVPHTLGKRPSITVYDSAGDECEGTVTYIDNNNVTLNFSAAFSGTVICN